MDLRVFKQSKLAVDCVCRDRFMLGQRIVPPHADDQPLALNDVRGQSCRVHQGKSHQCGVKFALSDLGFETVYHVSIRNYFAALKDGAREVDHRFKGSLFHERGETDPQRLWGPGSESQDQVDQVVTLLEKILGSSDQ
jgi:hypothetical protein